jgi:hypothetical protein
VNGCRGGSARARRQSLRHQVLLLSLPFPSALLPAAVHTYALQTSAAVTTRRAVAFLVHVLVSEFATRGADSVASTTTRRTHARTLVPPTSLAPLLPGPKPSPDLLAHGVGHVAVRVTTTVGQTLDHVA